MKSLLETNPGDVFMVAPPDQRSLSRLKTIFSGGPISIDWNLVVLRLADTSSMDQKWEPRKVTYKVKFTDFGLVYDEELGRSVLAGTVDSPEAQARSNELGMGDSEPPFRLLVIFSESIQLSSTNKAFIASVANTLVEKELEPFVFGYELQVNGGI